jgi:hypothetical protein
VLQEIELMQVTEPSQVIKYGHVDSPKHVGPNVPHVTRPSQVTSPKQLGVPWHEAVWTQDG